MMHTNLVNYYERVFAFKQYHQWNISEIDELMPWEFDVMTSLLSNYLETMEMHRKQAAASGG
ncbi:hypothetical protein [Synechococcus phage S-B68]|nr:hypothetical protein [Synechococcus phage S-B68]